MVRAAPDTQHAGSRRVVFKLSLAPGVQSWHPASREWHLSSMFQVSTSHGSWSAGTSTAYPAICSGWLVLGGELGSGVITISLVDDQVAMQAGKRWEDQMAMTMTMTMTVL
ncbi:uncharacterized protein LOC113461380 [Phoenix dactylifera]|uniref:Uncharacterized protein LOC113461380 n=1 Tax=Phoenix dactylifera TaxID=42345 RepID=A0A8B9AKI9_PHODC|nr:uncharacterized protein LOC113461380 [Phoenix dactylifera]